MKKIDRKKEAFVIKREREKLHSLLNENQGVITAEVMKQSEILDASIVNYMKLKSTILRKAGY